jgi:3-oxoacyl-[acyl-carrier protein] reductase
LVNNQIYLILQQPIRTLRFKDKRILVTGGTRGIGKAVALAFAREGARVAVSYASDDENAAKTGQALANTASGSLVFRSDVSQKSDVDRMVGEILSVWDHIDVLVNNAGVIADKMLMFLDEADWDRVIDVNLKGTYLCSRAVIKSMVAGRFGRIINIVSPSAITGRAGQTNYSASKGGVIAFTKSLSRETARIGITANCVCPGVISTAMTTDLSEEIRADLKNMIPMGRFGDPGDVAESVLFFASEAAGYITGQVLAVDGGLI